MASGITPSEQVTAAPSDIERIMRDHYDVSEETAVRIADAVAKVQRRKAERRG